MQTFAKIISLFKKAISSEILNNIDRFRTSLYNIVKKGQLYYKIDSVDNKKGCFIVLVKYLDYGSQFLEFEIKTDLSGFILALKETECIKVNNEEFILERIELSSEGTDDEVLHMLLVFLKRKY